MILQGLEYIAAAKLSVHCASFKVCCIQNKMIVVDQAVVPRRTRAIVTEIIARHFLVAGKPARIIINALARTIRASRLLLATCRNTV